MFRLISFSACALFVASLGCGTKSPAPPPGPQPIQRSPKDGPFDWVNNPPADTTYDFNTLELKSQRIRAAMQRWASAAHGMRDADWHHQSWYRAPEYLDTIVTWWSDRPDAVGPYGRLARSCPSRLVRVYCHYASPSSGLEWASLQAQYAPPDGLGVWLFVTMHDDGLRLAALCFRTDIPVEYEYGDGGGGVSLLDLGVWKHSDVFETIHYDFELVVGEAEKYGGVFVSASEFARWQASPESLKAAFFEPLDALEEALREGIASGTAVKRTYSVQGGTHGGDPPIDLPDESNRALTSQEKQKVLDLGLEEIARRRRIIERRYKEMYEALMQVFPLDQIAEPALK